MDPIDLTIGNPYRVTGSGPFGGVTGQGVLEWQVGDVLIFRNVEKDPVVGFPTAWFVRWGEIERIEAGTWEFKEDPDGD